MAEFTHESTEDQEEEELQEEVLDFAPAALDDSLQEVEDPLQEINLGTEEDPRPTFISALLKESLKSELIALLQEFRDCFAWHYHEMPGLDRELVEHKLPIKEGYLPVKQAKRRMTMDTELKVKEEIERLLKARFIKPTIYADWLANIVPVLKRKTGAVRIYVDYRNLNEASPKDEYPMPMVDMLVDGAAHNQMLSFMDGNAGYNQIMVAEGDIHKTAFMCPGHIGAFEYIVMPFGIRNAGATYQRAMNSVFHDMEQTFKWEEQHQQVFEEIKHYLSNPPVLSPPKRGRPLKLYTLHAAIHHLHHCQDISDQVHANQANVERQNWKMDIDLDRICLQEIENMDSLDIENADLLTRAHTCFNNPIYSVHLIPWKLYFDGSKTNIAYGAGIVLEEPLGIRHCYSFQLDFQCTNNRAKYEALIIGLEMLVELGIQSVEILGDSMLVLKQIAGEYKCLSPSLAVYLVAARNLLTEFREATWEHIPREENWPK
ncbi:unnamed protein product [Prunus armeniaca]